MVSKNRGTDYLPCARLESPPLKKRETLQGHKKKRVKFDGS